MNEQQLRLRLEALGVGPPTADWPDARARGENLHKRRTRLTIAFAVLAAVVVAAPTLAVATGRIDFWSAERAPESWKKVFAELDRLSERGPGSSLAIPFKEARAAITKEIDGKRVTLYVAPRDRGFCLYLLGELVPGGGGGAGACVDDGDRLARFGELRAGKGRPESRRIFGSTAAAGARQFEVMLADGTSVTTDIVWVSEPIDAGLYLAEVPARPTAESFVVRDADGRELARLGLP